MESVEEFNLQASTKATLSHAQHVHLESVCSEIDQSSCEWNRRAMMAATIFWFVLPIAVGVLMVPATRVAATEGTHSKRRPRLNYL